MLLVSSGPVGNRRRVVGLALGALIFLAGWGVLVWLAVLRAQDKEWGFVAIAAVGAAACLFVALLLWTRMRAVRRGETKPRRTPSHRA
jgi:tetrahydromethanopterin S-methyltransferase subunit E